MLIIQNLFIIYLKSSKTHTSAVPLLLEKGAEVKTKLQDLKLLIDKKTLKFYLYKNKKKNILHHGTTLPSK